ncbi:hypothetical protein O9K51_08190 [Purpureocillium lavendulum]|uniref:Uncharacterized protein n=1 Tax=Purpureocillium lavendulum TaxID=1247861 RepID=A0AB34FHB8_9HYPO|nr:hypothetical protein O9K51_08190 [Purpureocillium lavendulum]
MPNKYDISIVSGPEVDLDKLAAGLFDILRHNDCDKDYTESGRDKDGIMLSFTRSLQPACVPFSYSLLEEHLHELGYEQRLPRLQGPGPQVFHKAAKNTPAVASRRLPAPLCQPW